MAHSLVEALENLAERIPQKQSLIFLGADKSAKTITPAQLHQDAIKYANALHKLGLKAGDLAVLVFEHSYELVAMFWGAIYLGVVPTIFPYFTPKSSSTVYARRIKQLVEAATAQAVITIPQFERDLADLLTDTGCLVLGFDKMSTDATPDDTAHICRERGGGDAAYIQFSSGTTSTSKGAVLSHQAVLSHVTTFGASLPFTKDDVSVGWLPFFHDMGLVTQLLLPLLTGARSVFIAPNHWALRPGILFWAIDKYKGTMTWMPNFGFNHCVRGVRDRDLADLDLSSWRIVGNGAEAVQYDSLQQFAKRFAAYNLSPQALMVGYGMAENVVAVALTPADSEADVDWVSTQDLQEKKQAIPATPHSDEARPIMSCGYPIQETHLKIADEQGNFLPERHVGEVVIQGSSCFSGYYHQPELTASAIQNGWFYTGDLGYMVGEQVYLCGRKKDLIISGGKNIQPHHIEHIARTVLGRSVAQVVAFGQLDKAAGTEVPVLVCELRKRFNEEEQYQLSRQIRQQVQYELDVRLADVCFVKRGWVIKTTSAKIARADNRRKYETLMKTKLN